MKVRQSAVSQNNPPWYPEELFSSWFSSNPVTHYKSGETYYRFLHLPVVFDEDTGKMAVDVQVEGTHHVITGIVLVSGEMKPGSEIYACIRFRVK